MLKAFKKPMWITAKSANGNNPAKGLLSCCIHIIEDIPKHVLGQLTDPYYI
jgi:hypothetical protein